MISRLHISPYAHIFIYSFTPIIIQNLVFSFFVVFLFFFSSSNFCFSNDLRFLSFSNSCRFCISSLRALSFSFTISLLWFFSANKEDDDGRSKKKKKKKKSHLISMLITLLKHPYAYYCHRQHNLQYQPFLCLFLSS
jgi:hypothetical protein